MYRSLLRICMEHNRGYYNVFYSNRPNFPHSIPGLGEEGIKPLEIGSTFLLEGRIAWCLLADYTIRH